MVDLLGPDASGATPTLTTTADVTAPIAGDTWFEDCTSGSAGTGTPIVAKWLNWMLQQVRVAERAASIPLANSYDNMLSWAMQSGATNWIGAAGGSANALTGAADNNPIAVTAGTRVFGIASATNTGVTTFNWTSLGDDPLRDISGTNLVGGELVNGNVFGVIRVASHWRLITPLPLSLIFDQIYKTDIQTFDASGTWVPPAGFVPQSRVIIEIWGGGAGSIGGHLGGAGGNYERFDTYLDWMGLGSSNHAVIVGPGGIGKFYTDTIDSSMNGSPSYFAYGEFANGFIAHGGMSVSVAGGAPSLFVPLYLGHGGDGTFGLGTGDFPNAFGGGGGGNGGQMVMGGPNNVGGTSVLGGAGGASDPITAAPQPGTVPGGGAGAGNIGNVPGIDGAHGRVRVTTIQG